MPTQLAYNPYTKAIAAVEFARTVNTFAGPKAPGEEYEHEGNIYRVPTRSELRKLERGGASGVIGATPIRKAPGGHWARNKGLYLGGGLALGAATAGLLASRSK